jgi:hypothetical protein
MQSGAAKAAENVKEVIGHMGSRAAMAKPAHLVPFVGPQTRSATAPACPVVRQLLLRRGSPSERRHGDRHHDLD